MTSTFHLVRHATHADLGRRLSGRGGGGLTPAGRTEAHALAATLCAVGCGEVFASPQARAAETAAILAAAAGCAVGLAPELDEIDFGRWTGLSFAALDGDPAWRAWNADRGGAPAAGGETMRQVADRLTGLVDRLRADRPGGTVTLVSHADVIKAGVCRYLGLPFAHLHRFEVSPASITTLAVGDWGGAVLALNRRGGPEDAAA